MRKTRVFGQLMGVQGMVIGDVKMQPDPDGDGEILVVSVRPDARSGGRCAQCRRSCPGYDAGVAWGWPVSLPVGRAFEDRGVRG